MKFAELVRNFAPLELNKYDNNGDATVTSNRRCFAVYRGKFSEVVNISSIHVAVDIFWEISTSDRHFSHQRHVFRNQLIDFAVDESVKIHQGQRRNLAKIETV